MWKIWTENEAAGEAGGIYLFKDMPRCVCMCVCAHACFFLCVCVRVCVCARLCVCMGEGSGHAWCMVHMT